MHPKIAVISSFQSWLQAQNIVRMLLAIRCILSSAFTFKLGMSPVSLSAECQFQVESVHYGCCWWLWRSLHWWWSDPWHWQWCRWPQLHWSYLANHLKLISCRLADLSDLLPHLSATVHPSIQEHYCKNRPSKNINAFPGFHYCYSLSLCVQCA